MAKRKAKKGGLGKWLVLVLLLGGAAYAAAKVPVHGATLLARARALATRAPARAKAPARAPEEKLTRADRAALDRLLP